MVGVMLMLMKVGRVESSFTVLVVHVENVSEQLESFVVEITDLIIIIRSEKLILLLLLLYCLLFWLVLLVMIVGKVLGEVLITPVEDGRERISVVIGVIGVVGVVVCYWVGRKC